MSYAKPEGMKYTDLCIEFDNEFYTENRDDEKLYRYMYLIFRMLAFKKSYFRNFADYDGFAQFAASTIYMRFMKKQMNGERVKSLLNYAKASLYPLKVMYQNEAFNMTTEASEDEDVFDDSLSEKMRQSIQSDYQREYLVSAIYDELNNLIDFIDDVVKHTPYAKNAKMRKNLRMSMMLTMLSQTTLSNENKRKLNKKLDTKSNKNDELFMKFMEIERTSEPLLWCVSPSLKQYVSMLVNKVRKNLGKEINDTRAAYTLPDDVLDSIVASAYADKFSNDDEWLE